MPGAKVHETKRFDIEELDALVLASMELGKELDALVLASMELGKEPDTMESDAGSEVKCHD
jgi:hypothetical protein